MAELRHDEAAVPRLRSGAWPAELEATRRAMSETPKFAKDVRAVADVLLLAASAVEVQGDRISVLELALSDRIASAGVGAALLLSPSERADPVVLDVARRVGGHVCENVSVLVAAAVFVAAGLLDIAADATGQPVGEIVARAARGGAS